MTISPNSANSLTRCGITGYDDSPLRRRRRRRRRGNMVIEHGIATRRPLGAGGILWHQPQKNPEKKEKQKNEKDRETTSTSIPTLKKRYIRNFSLSSSTKIDARVVAVL